MIIEDLLSGKVKLEFGNREQIETIDNYEKAQVEAREGLKLYKVIFHFSGSADVDVEAYDEQDAIEKAKEEECDLDIEWEDLEHIQVELIREIEEEGK